MLSYSSTPVRSTMIRACQKFLLYLTTAADRQLIRQVEYLKSENQILRSKLPKRITVTRAERNRLVELGKAIGTAINQLVSIVTPRTFARWLTEDNKPAELKSDVRKPGRPATPEDIREVILRLARENGWGYTRILGELKKLGIAVSRSTVVNILKENGVDPGPKCGEGTWNDFIKRHTQTLWACDFFSKKVWTLGGMVDVFVLFFIHIGSRRVFVSGMTANPDNAWMVQQARNFSMTFADQPIAPTHLILDLDSKFSTGFREILESDAMEMVRVGPRAPNLNCYAERFVQTIKSECLNYFFVFGINHLRYLIDQFIQHYHVDRPHQGLDNEPLNVNGESPATLPFPKGEVVCRERLGGLLKSYSRQAA